MAVKLSPITVETLEAYVFDRLDIRQLAAWLAQAAYDDELGADDLVVTEVREDMRPETEAKQAVGEALSSSVAPRTRTA